MKKNRLFALLLAGSLAALTACSGNTASVADYIGIEAAKEAALKASSIPAEQAAFSSAALESKNGTSYYQVVFTENNNVREYAIDAMTGVVIEEKIQPVNNAVEETTAEATSPAAPSEALDVFASASKEAAASGEAQSQTAGAEGSQSQAAEAGEASAAASSAPSSGGPVTGESALALAISHAGLSDGDVAFSKVKQDFDDGISLFEVEFVANDGTEYDYEIRANDGTILSFDQDAEYKFPPSSGSSGIIDESQAKQAVLDRVPGAKAEDISIRLREDDGRTEYKGHLFYDNMMYEFKIDAFSGNLIEWEAELKTGKR